MSKKVKINGVWVEVKDEDVQDGDTSTDADKDTDTDTGNGDGDDTVDGDGTGDGDDNLSDGEKASIQKEAKKMGREIAKSMMGEIGKDVDGGKVDQLQKTVDNLIQSQMPANSKLHKILNGKDLVSDRSTLTKEEVIVGFYHALVTNNQIALKALAEGVDADGGFLFPNEFLTEMVRDLPNINVMRQWIRIIPMKRDNMDITNLISGPEVTWTAENVAKSTTTARWSRLTLTAYKVAAILYSSDELIEDSDIFDVVAMIIGLFSEAIAEEEERVIWVGDGTTQPQGIDTAGTLGSFIATNQNFDDIVTLHYNLPRKYRNNAVWFMNDATMADVRTLKDSNNNYIIQNFGLNANQTAPADALLGKQVVISDWVPDGQIYFMDARRLYFLGDRKRMTVKISQDTTQAFTQDMTAIRVVSRIGGLVVQPLAGRRLTGF